MSIFKPTWLYIKQHNQTGLKYFGKTVNDPSLYQGSGLYWKRHLLKHGNDISTIWCHLYFDEEELVDDALNFSKLHDIVNSDSWANLMEENGLDGAVPGAARPNISKALKGRPAHNKGKPSPLKGLPSPKRGIPLSEEHKAKLRIPSPKKGVPMSEEQKIKLKSPKERFVCPHCNKDIGGKSNFNRYHGDKCIAKKKSPT